MEYFKFTLKRTTSDVFNLVGFGNDILMLIPRFALDFWYLFLVFSGLIILSVYLYNKASRGISSESCTQKNIFNEYLLSVPVFMIALSGFIIGARGGLQLRPIDIINANESAIPQNIPLVLNTPFTLIKTIAEEGITEKSFFSENELNEIYSPVHHLASPDSFTYQNIVLIIMESFANEYVGIMNPGIKRETYTPFLDSLAQHSLVFDRCYANGRKSIEGIPAIVASLPSLMTNPFITSPYAANKINSLAGLLKNKGYQTAFFHGGTNGTMGFDVFARAAGFDQYYGRNEYNNESDYDGNWGIFDEEFFQYFANNLNSFKQPFLGCFFSLSSHHPYTIPGKHKNRFKQGKLKIHPCIQYADYSLRRFFETASGMPWYNNTLFVITSDHSATSLLPFFTTSAGAYSVPLLFYSPGKIVPAINHKATQQCDILPTLLDLLNYEGKFISFGQNNMNSGVPGLAINYMNGIYQLTTDRHVFQFDGEHALGLYDWPHDQLLKNNILAVDSATTMKLEQKIKAIIQSYNYRLLHNQLSAD